ncbi:helix-hairpin-helix domain-containing protein [Clostridium lacusfryxellense]|uniref:helix-hairpin-helix domain-containing protein n=1 Tax=Clostridium lacusfryxellense TaxID=205328 RepID=UPI001C0B4A0E|nr:helix-hairpin-helix domain-containing protein [Clostridium lacusfryxellense]MBU3110438.1 helix-hairpin-helix domain-containing protein [Clostridium lacusfryxellense]
MKNKEKIIGSMVILVISVVCIISGYVLSRPKENVNVTDYENMFVETGKTSEKKVVTDPTQPESNKAAVSNAKVEVDTKIEDSNIKVDIKGAVKEPGVYEIKKGSRVTDLIKLAGGGTSDADLDATNLSAKLNDEDCIVINKKGEEGKTQITQINPQGSTTSSAGAGDKDSIVNINTASKEELMTLTGIGEAKAGVIIEYREQNGGFKSVDELTEVGGIGEKTLGKFKDKIDIK